jgi:hypothetical protein
MIDLSRVVAGNLLTESYTIQRSTGFFGPGGSSSVSTSIPGFGVVSVASDQDLQMVPEGDRVTGAMVFHSQERIYETQVDANGKQRISDKILWNFQLYRVLTVGPYPNRGFWRAIGVRMAGQ